MINLRSSYLIIGITLNLLSPSWQLLKAHIVSACLDQFCDVSGSKVSCDKSRVFFSENTPVEVRGELCDTLNIGETDDLGTKYCEGSCDVEMFRCKGECSIAWRGIMDNIDVLKKGISMAVGNGNNTSF